MVVTYCYVFSFGSVSSSSGLTSTIGLGNGHHFTSLSVHASTAEPSTSSKKGRKSTSASSSSSGGSSSSASSVLSINTWGFRSLLECSSLYLNAESSSSNKTTLQLQAGESLVTACAHSHIDSVSVILHNSSSNSTRWVKININGDVLFERSISQKPKTIVEVGEQLWIIHDLSKISLWDVKFGVEVKVFQLNPAPAVVGGVGYVLPYGYAFNPDVDTSAGTTVVPCHLVVSALSSTGESTSLYRHTLTSETQAVRSTLCSAIGKMSTSASANSTSVDGTPFNVSIYDDSNQVLVSAGSDANGGAAASGRVLAGLPGPMKRKLKQIQTLYDNQVKLELSELTSTNDMDSPEDRFAKKYRRFYLDIPDSVSRVS